MKGKEFNLAHLLLAVAALACVLTIIPSLLDATNDLAVLVGVLLVVALVYGVVKNAEKILAYFGLNKGGDE